MRDMGDSTTLENDAAGGDFQRVDLRTERGIVAARHYPVSQAASAAILLGGIGGGFDSPAKELYPRLARELRARGIASLRVRFRDPQNLDEAVHDVLAGCEFLGATGIERIALVGHSFGGAVVVQAALQAESVATVVTLATQSYGADLAARLAPRCSILLIHGLADSVLPPACSRHIHAIAGQPKRLVLFEHADHTLDEVADQAHDEALSWIAEKIGAARHERARIVRDASG
jgi:pimeloyl-ACP methyl ester carboxylesterase